MNVLRRHEPLHAWDEGDATVILAGERTLRFEGDSAALVRALLSLLATPRAREALLDALASRSGDALDAPAVSVIDAHLRTLARHGVIAEGPAPTRAAGPSRRVLLAVTGAVAAVDAPALARLLLARGHEVRVVLTRNARRFVSARALEAITHAPVPRSLWRGAAQDPAPHIALARWAELVAVYPCTATTLARLAAGDASELLAATVCATAARVILAPSMNHEMLASAAVQENLQRLRDRGVLLAHPGVGVEVADAPEAREDMLGPAMAPDAFARVLDVLLAALPAPPPSWEEHYALQRPRPWELDADPELDALLAAHAPPGSHPRMIEVGCGLGRHAHARAAMGYAVTATELSRSALARACSQGDGVTWVCDDVRRSNVQGRFDVVVDRGCLHVLDEAGRAAYVAQVERWLGPGGVLAIKVHAHDAQELGTARFTEAALDEALGTGFARVCAQRCAFGGAATRTALAAVYRRR